VLNAVGLIVFLRKNGPVKIVSRSQQRARVLYALAESA
jgi:hypothetical protein